MVKKRLHPGPSSYYSTLTPSSSRKRSRTTFSSQNTNDMSYRPHQSFPKVQRGHESNTPLRRGAACLMCRAKKLKCSATKPRCDQCTKRHDRCVYDPIRPASRVEQLTKKLEMEENDRKAAAKLLAERREQSVFSNPQSQIYQNYNYNFVAPLSDHPDVYSNMPTTAPVSSVTSSPADPQQNILPVDNNSVNTWQNWQPNSDQNRNQQDPFDTTALRESFLTLPPNPNPMPWISLGSSNDVTTYDTTWVWNMSQPQALTSAPLLPVTEPVQPTGTTQNRRPSTSQQVNQNPTSGYSSIRSGQIASAPPFPSFFDQSFNFFPSVGTSSYNLGPNTCIPAEATAAVESVLDHAALYDAPHLDERDITQSAKDYLLELFFSPPREAFGTEVFSEAQFKAKMALPPKERHHPCLVFAMYTEAASSSFIPAVRALAEPLYDITCHKIEQSIQHHDRLLDAIRASKMIGKWLFGRARPLEGYSWTAKSVSLALACGLDKIPSSVFTPQDKNPTKARSWWPLLGPPEDQWELCERIHVFWSVWGNEQGACTITGWPSSIRDDLVTTPLPRPREEFLDGSIRNKPDLRLQDIYDIPADGSVRLDNMIGWRFASIHLHKRARDLITQKPEALPTYRVRPDNPIVFDATTPARIKYPEQYRELVDTIDHLMNNLPPELVIDYSAVERGEQPWGEKEVPLFHVLMAIARITLHRSIATDAYDRQQALQAGHTQATLIKLWINQIRAEDMKESQNVPGRVGSSGVNPSTRGKNGIAGPYLLMYWFMGADILREGAAILTALGDLTKAQECANDAEAIITGLQSLGVTYPSSTEEADSGILDLNQKGMFEV